MSWAYTASQALSWIKSRRTPFCIYTPCDSTVTLLALLRVSTTERIWAILKVVSSTADGEAEVELGERTRVAAEACLPQNIFGDSTPEFTKALKSLPGLSPNVGESGMLRVLVSFSEELDVSHLPCDTAYPVAVLNMNTIRQATKAYESASITKCIMKNVMNNTPATPSSSSKRKRASSTAGVARDADPSPDARSRTSKRAVPATSSLKIALSSRAARPLTRSQTGPRRSGRLAG
ncbi:hypothetical protein V5O48_018699 [Marasmius crinis-equi]|uniref:Uncharacterized protein n=1 Tax=Marasmius crinis-equi TaxID=585013 RepID=A0ABR3EKE9_9AGAR